jgi:hypothetical protein
MTIPGQFGFNCPSGFREERFQNGSSLKPLGQLKPNCPGMIIGRSSTKCLFFMPIGNPRWPPPGSNVKLSPAVAAILNFISEQKNLKVCRGPSNEHSCSLALIIFVVSEKKAFEHFPIGSMGKMFQNGSSLKPLGQLKPNCPGMVIGWSSINLRFLFRYEIQSCGNGHLGFPIGMKNINFVEDLPMIIPGQFGFNCPSGFREEAF